jgi:ankyrin repeat protein
MSFGSSSVSEKLKKLGTRIDSQHSLNYALIYACINNDLDIVKYCLTSPELKLHAQVHADEDQPLRNACKFGHLDIVKYLVASPDLKEHANPQHPDNIFLYSAYDNNKIEVIKYLLGSPEVLNKPDIHINKDETFIDCTKYKLYDIVNYLIFDFNIEKTEYISTYLKNNPDEKINSWFDLRDLNKSLNAELNSDSNKESNKKPKL